VALFKKYTLKKEALMEDWEAVDEIKPLLEKLGVAVKDGIKKEDIFALLKKVLVKRNWLGKERQLTDDEIKKIKYIDGHKYAADFFFKYMRQNTIIAKHYQNSAKKLVTPLPKSRVSNQN
jgi:hypothetical protein